VPEELRDQQLRILGIVSAIKDHERGSLWALPHLDGIAVHGLGQFALAYTAFTQDQSVQALGGVNHRRFSLLDLRAQASLPADEIGEGPRLLFHLQAARGPAREGAHRGRISAFRQLIEQTFHHVAGKLITAGLQFLGKSAHGIIMPLL